MLNSYKDYNKFIICFVILCFLGGLLGVQIGMLIKNNYVYADYVDDIVNNPQAIVNFNQQVVNQYTNGTLSQGGWYDLSSNVISGHDYYVKVICSSIGETNGFFFSYSNHSEATLQTIFLINSAGTYDLKINASRTHFCTYTNSAMTLTGCMLIDLTQMFGSSNIPTLAQCRDIFTSDYYSYNIGTPITYNTIDAYNNGVNAYLGSQEYTISSLGFINSVYPVVLNSEYGCEESLVSRNTSQGYVQVDNGSSYNSPTLCLPFNYTIPAGTQITIKGKCSTTQYHASYSMHVGFWGNGGDMIVVPQGMQAGTQGFFTSSTITFTLPMSVDRIYLIVTDDATWQLKDFEVGYYLTNVDTLRELGYQDGVAYMEKLYAPTGAYYQAIYQLGYNAGHDAPTYTFKDLIVASVDTPIKAFTSLFDYDILGVNMKTFYLSVFTMCVIFVVLKLVL